ncbi:hypothetical protein, partial [Actinomadura bangladeshensis]|uniref:hypothetical protein n=1 Tax=Actinomadura bangladeshensis TaxID=453573 RepID=UPI0031D03D55
MRGISIGYSAPLTLRSSLGRRGRLLGNLLLLGAAAGLAAAGTPALAAASVAAVGAAATALAEV